MLTAEFQLSMPSRTFTRNRRGVDVVFSVRETALICPPDERETWERCRQSWRGSRNSTAAQQHEYSKLLATKRYHFVERDGESMYGFAEGYLARTLLGHYDDVWTGAYLFRPIPKQLSIRRRNSEEISERLESQGFPTHEQLSAFQDVATDVDVAAYDSRQNRWCFCEVKRREPVERKQVAGLALLHLLLGADVGIVRVGEDPQNLEEHLFHFAWEFPS